MTNSSGFVAYFGTELRRHRERLGWPREQLAERVPWSVWTVASVEQGRRKPPPGLGEHADALFNLPGVMTELSKKAQDDSTPFGDRIELEQRADAIYEYDMRLVPGLLQTEQYARLVHRARQHLSSEQVEELVQLRMRRQRIFDQEPPPLLHAIIDEAVLCRRIGDPLAMREQLQTLTAPRRNITIQVLPFSACLHEAIDGPITIMCLPEEPDVAYSDGWSRGQLIDTPGEVLRAQRAFQHLAALALPPDLSAEMIESYAEEA
jgi:transcriptional regulator with XRE-family HTH domain